MSYVHHTSALSTTSFPNACIIICLLCFFALSQWISFTLLVGALHGIPRTNPCTELNYTISVFGWGTMGDGMRLYQIWCCLVTRRLGPSLSGWRHCPPLSSRTRARGCWIICCWSCTEVCSCRPIFSQGCSLVTRNLKLQTNFERLNSSQAVVGTLD